MNKNELKIVAHSLIETFDIAARESIELYNKGLKIEIKDDKSPVSNGDLKVNELITNRITRFIATFYTTVVRGVPELLVIYLIFFGGNSVLMSVAKLFGYNGYIELNALTIGTIAIAFISATYSSEVIRAAYLAVNKGQVEAAKALGLNRIQIFLRVMGPQIIRHALPGIGNVWQITLKDTSLISVTGLVEIMRQTRIASNVEHSPLTFLITAAFLYLFLTTFSGKFFKVLEINYSKGYS